MAKIPPSDEVRSFHRTYWLSVIRGLLYWAIVLFFLVLFYSLILGLMYD